MFRVRKASGRSRAGNGPWTFFDRSEAPVDARNNVHYTFLHVQDRHAPDTNTLIAGRGYAAEVVIVVFVRE